MSIPRWLSGKESPAVQEPWVGSLHQEEPLAKEMVTHSSSLAWEVHGQRSLAGFSPWGCKDSDMTLQLNYKYFRTNRFSSLGLSLLTCNVTKLKQTTLQAFWQLNCSITNSRQQLTADGCFCLVAQSYLTLWPHGLQHTRLPCPSHTLKSAHVH